MFRKLSRGYLFYAANGIIVSFRRSELKEIAGFTTTFVEMFSLFEVGGLNGADTLG